MNPEKQRIAIAEACGWTHIAFNRGWIKAGDGEIQGVIPDFLNDLNSMHEAEKMLTHDQQVGYSVNMVRLTTWNMPSSRAAWLDFTIAHATAAQRAEAFLETIGKWEE